MAERLGKTLQEVKRGTSSTEFNLWREFFAFKKDQDGKQHSKLEHYLAVLTMHIYLLRKEITLQEASTKPDDFLIKLTRRKKSKKAISDDMKDKILNAKLALGLAVGGDVSKIFEHG